MTRPAGQIGAARARLIRVLQATSDQLFDVVDAALPSRAVAWAGPDNGLSQGRSG